MSFGEEPTPGEELPPSGGDARLESPETAESGIGGAPFEVVAPRSLGSLELAPPASTLTIREVGDDESATPSGDAAAPVASETQNAPIERPTYVFLGVVSALTLFADIATKAWAEVVVNQRGFEPIDLIGKNLSVTLAYNRGGAWGMLQNTSELVRKPFFICVSLAAIWFIVSLYSRLHRSQKALTWGLPLVLGGALGNLSDRITRSQVVDFIDYQADWVMRFNAWVRQYVDGWTVTDHWPTFNVADIAICIGVGLMAVDMFTSRRRHGGSSPSSDTVPPSSPASVSA